MVSLICNFNPFDLNQVLLVSSDAFTGPCSICPTGDLVNTIYEITSQTNIDVIKLYGPENYISGIAVQIQDKVKNIKIEVN